MFKQRKVFIADDDETALFSLKELLTEAGFKVKGTSKAKEVFSRIKSFKPNLILLDLLMRGLGGFEICQMLNEHKQTKGIPLIIISALSDEVDVKRAYQMGVVDYFTKPYDCSELLQKINKYINYKAEEPPLKP